MRDLRNQGAETLARVVRGESLIVTRDGTPVAAVVPLRRTSPSPVELVARRRHLPRVDPDALRADLDAVLDARL